MLVSAVMMVAVLSVLTWVCFLGWSDDHPTLFWWERVGALCALTAAAAVGVRWLGPWWAWLCTSVPLAAVGAYETFHADVLGPIGAVVWVYYAVLGSGVLVAVVTGVRWVFKTVRHRGIAVHVPDR